MKVPFVTIPRLSSHEAKLLSFLKEQRNVTNIIKELEPIYKSLDDNFTYNAYANDIAWNLALAYIKDNQIDKAVPVLEKLEKDNPDMPIRTQAENLLRTIRSL